MFQCTSDNIADICDDIMCACFCLFHRKKINISITITLIITLSLFEQCFTLLLLICLPRYLTDLPPRVTFGKIYFNLEHRDILYC